MTEWSPAMPRGWRDGMHPGAAGMPVRSLERVELLIGDAIRVEMASADAGDDVAHLQFFICTEAGGWALWASCPRAELADREAALHAISPLTPGR
jgi:hypothetical protein